MRIVVASARDAGSMWAGAINTFKMAEGFARLGHQVTIVCNESVNGKLPPADLSALYGFTEDIRWVQLPTKFMNRDVDMNWGFPWLALLPTVCQRPDLVFARSYVFPWLSSILGITTIAESHAYTDNLSPPLLRLVKATHHRAFRLWVTISDVLADHYHSLGVPREKLIVLPDAVDLRLFQRPDRLPASPYPDDAIPNVTYSGQQFADYKGIPTILEAAGLLPGVRFHLVGGGGAEDMARHKKHASDLGLSNVVFHGLRPHSAVPPFLWHADVLLVPLSQHDPNAVWTSPVKLGEYLASQTPVVVTSVPAMKTWLSDAEAKFVNPDDPESLANGIMNVLRNPDYAASLSRAGLAKAKQWTYERRAKRILDRLGVQ